jgi:hypothetical protein
MNVSSLKQSLEELNQELNLCRNVLHEEMETHAIYSGYKLARVSKSEAISRITSLQQQILSIKSNRGDAEVSIADVGEIQCQIDSTILEIEKRKRIAKEMLDQISEQSGMSRSDLIGDLGLEMNVTIRGA